MNPLEILLVASVVVSAVGVCGVSMGIARKRHNWVKPAQRIGLLGGAILSFLLAGILARAEPPEPSNVRTPLLTWYQIPGPREISLDFGLEATWIRSTMIGLVGVGLLMKDLIGRWRATESGSESVRLAESLLFVATQCFLLAPNLAQSLFGWGAISLLVSILVRLASGPIDAVQPIAGPTASARASHYFSLSWPSIELFLKERVWKARIMPIPQLIVDQVELIEQSPLSIRLLAILLGSSAILLTWLIVT